MYIHDDDKPPIVPYIIASLAVHLLIVTLFPYHIESPSWKEKVVEVIPIVEKGNKPYEIADIAKPAIEKKPKSARFLGMYDSSADQETVAITRKQGSKEAGKQGREEVKKQEARSQKSEARSQKPEAGSKEEKLTIGKTKSLYNVDKKLFAMKTPDLGGSKGIQIGGSAALEDYYPDYKLGTRTYLNVLRYPEIEYFVRMKRQFKMTFNPVPSLRGYFANNRVTRGSVEVVLAVSVNRDGNLSELFVLNGSGISTYDQEAMRTIRASAPFATPPDKFLEDDGLLRMSWTFTVYL